MNEAAAGWHGKLPTLSDFASRRLDARFVELWDEGLSSSLTALQEQEGERWVAAYLACPTWRFVIGPGVIEAPFDACGWAGVVMPSVDRVGRYFPLVLAAPLEPTPQIPTGTSSLWGWLQALEDAAVNALHEDWPVEQIEAELIRLGLPQPRESTQAQGDVLDGLAAPLLPPPEVLKAQEPDLKCLWYSQCNGAAVKYFKAPSLQEALCNLWTHHLEHT